MTVFVFVFCKASLHWSLPLRNCLNTWHHLWTNCGRTRVRFGSVRGSRLSQAFRAQSLLCLEWTTPAQISHCVIFWRGWVCVASFPCGPEAEKNLIPKQHPPVFLQAAHFAIEWGNIVELRGKRLNPGLSVSGQVLPLVIATIQAHLCKGLGRLGVRSPLPGDSVEIIPFQINWVDSTTLCHQGSRPVLLGHFCHASTTLVWDA
jgi:hypothetical protein